MIAFLKGTVSYKDAQKAYLDVQGVGFEVNMSHTSLAALPEVGAEAMVLTYLQVRDDGMSLFGFATADEKSLFEKLIGVSGVGPKVALAALSYYTPSDLVGAIAAQDVTRVSKIPGIGKKTASRIILELKGSFDMNAASQLAIGQEEAPAPAAAQADAGVREALLSMGFTSTEVDLALKGAADGTTESELLSYALKRLGSL